MIHNTPSLAPKSTPCLLTAATAISLMATGHAVTAEVARVTEKFQPFVPKQDFLTAFLHNGHFKPETILGTVFTGIAFSALSWQALNAKENDDHFALKTIAALGGGAVTTLIFLGGMAGVTHLFTPILGQTGGITVGMAAGLGLLFVTLTDNAVEPEETEKN
jgi:hypothetical protein